MTRITKATVSLYSVGTSARLGGRLTHSGRFAVIGRKTMDQLNTASVSAKPIRKPPAMGRRLAGSENSAYLGRIRRADERTRTADLLITSELLYLLSYVGLFRAVSIPQRYGGFTGRADGIWGG